MREHRRYSRRQKVEVVAEAERTSMSAASEKTGIPVTTIDYWMDQPEFVELRRKTREQLAEGSLVLANLAQAEIQRKVREGKVEPRDLAVIYGIAIDKAQLLAGMATNRTETKALTDGMQDHEKEALTEAIDAWLEGRTEAAVGAAEDGVGSEVRE